MFCLLLNVKLTGQGVFGGKSMAHKLTKVSALALAAAWLAAAPALAESAMQQLQGVQQQSDKAQRNPSLEGAKKQSGQGIDTKGSYAAPVRANRQPKPSPVGQPINGPGGRRFSSAFDLQ